MRIVTLVPHRLDYAKPLFQLSSDPLVYEHLAFRNESVDQVVEFIRTAHEEEKEGKMVSRVILGENQEVLGVTTLMNIDAYGGTAHLGTWIGRDYWGMGYNQAAKEAILTIAFRDLGLHTVFVGARKANVRSLKAQEKLFYITLQVEGKYPKVHEALEKKEKCPCTLNVVYREDFLPYNRPLTRFLCID